MMNYLKKNNTKMIKKFNDFLNESKNNKDILNLNDFNDDHIKGTKDDKNKPMFNNLPNKSMRNPYDILRSGKFIKIDGITGQIIGLKGNLVLLDIINKDTNEHEVKEYDVKYILKKLKS